MSYTAPSVLVYQQLANAGGVANITPDLSACIIGPCYNVLSYTAGSTASLINTAAVSSFTVVGSMALNSNVVTVTGVPSLSVGDTVFIPGATSAGGVLQTTVTGVASGSFTVATAAGTAVSNVVITKKGTITSVAAPNTFNFPNTTPGGVVQSSSVQVFFNNATVETLQTKFQGVSSRNTLLMLAASGTGNMTAASAVVSTVTNPGLFNVGDTVTVAGAGAAGATLTGKILTIVSTTITLDTPAVTTVSSAAITKVAPSNVNSNTSTLLVDAGDGLFISYTNSSSVAKTFTTTVSSVTNSTGTISSIVTADMMPSDMSVATTLSAGTTANATSITVISATGIAIGDVIAIENGTATGDLYTTVGGVSGTTISGLSPAIPVALSTGNVIRRVNNITVATRKVFNNQLVPATNPITSGANYTVTTTGTPQVTINANPALAYGYVKSTDVHIAYSALRTDLSGVVQEVTDTSFQGVLGAPTDSNPLSLAAQIALANTGTSVKCIAVPSNDLAGYQAGLELAEGAIVYGLVPLTQDPAILAAVQAHVVAMSVPERKAWRIALGNTAIPSTVAVGLYNSNLVNANGGNNTITLNAGSYVLTASNATFMSDGVVPGDSIVITAATGSPTQVGTLTVQTVLSNQQVVVNATGLATAVSYYVSRTLSKSQKADAIAAASRAFGNKRMVHVQSDTVGITINGAIKYLPGYYLAAAVAGMISGVAPQQGLTNMAVAGIADIKYSNFYFTRAQLSTISGAGTLLFVQDTPGGIPYIRHELTTDMSVLEYREVQKVKNWDYLSYYFQARLNMFIGKWNITGDSIQTIRQTITAAAERAKANKSPQIGAPLEDYNIALLAQDATNKDSLNCNLAIKIPSALNYLYLYLII